MTLVIEILNGNGAAVAVSGGAAASSTQVDAGTLAILSEFVSTLEQALLYAPRALQYARDNNDQMRVNIATGSLSDAGVVATMFGNRDVVPSYYGRGAPTSMDAREQQRQLSDVAAQNVATQRWVFT